ncbi:hypothetical protein S245_048137, partial [Arachis hypogaea]
CSLHQKVKFFIWLSPDSLDGDDDLLIDELRSTPRIITGSTDVAQLTYVNPYWAE